jgi:hypothetical protein
MCSVADCIGRRIAALDCGQHELGWAQALTEPRPFGTLAGIVQRQRLGTSADHRRAHDDTDARARYRAATIWYSREAGAEAIRFLNLLGENHRR